MKYEKRENTKFPQRRDVWHTSHTEKIPTFEGVRGESISARYECHSYLQHIKYKL